MQASQDIDYKGISDSCPPVVRNWACRILLFLGGWKHFISKYGFADEHVAEALGLEQWMHDRGPSKRPNDNLHAQQGTAFHSDEEFNPNDARHALKSAQIKHASDCQSESFPSVLQQNLDVLSAALELSLAERGILGFTVLMHTSSVLNTALNYLDDIDTHKLVHSLSRILETTPEDIREAIHPKARLIRSGLLKVNTTNTYFSSKLRLLTDDFAERMLIETDDLLSMFEGVFKRCSKAQLLIEDFHHIPQITSILLPYLDVSINVRRAGVNVLIHGDPGTGKTELAKLLAKEVGCALYDVSSEDEEGCPIMGEHRLRALRAAQNVMEKGNALILFDEASDIFDDGGFFNQATADKAKGWLNHQLDANPVPVIWITNSIQSIDPAFIRRFDIVQEVSVPPRSRRAEIIKAYSCNRLADATVTRLAEIDVLSPAVCQRAIKVAELVSEGNQQRDMENVVEHLIGETIKAQGHVPIRKNDTHQEPASFELAYLACNCDLRKITEGISRSRSARLCLYGPPGTGKSAYGQWLSRQLDLPFYTKRASDIISPWIGQTERNLDRVFREAERDGAVLLLDEVDGFLQDRRGMQHSWELTQVNELLVQLEHYSGVFIASTNLIDSLDQAALRRFDLKIHFDYMRPDQAWKMFLDYCRLMQLGVPQESIEQRIKKIENLTPGDFAVVLRCSRFQQIESPVHFAEALENECSLKEDGKKRTIGFV